MTNYLPEDGAVSVPLLEVKSSWSYTASMTTAEEAVTQCKRAQNVCDVNSMLMLDVKLIMEEANGMLRGASCKGDVRGGGGWGGGRRGATGGRRYTGGGKEAGTDMLTIGGASCKAEAHGSRAGATSPGVPALFHLHVSHVQEGVPEVYGTCSPQQLTVARKTMTAAAVRSDVAMPILPGSVQVLLTAHCSSCVCRVNAASEGAYQGVGGGGGAA